MLNKKATLEKLFNSGYRPARLRELARRLSIDEDDYRHFRKLIRELVREGKMLRLRGGKYAVASEGDSGTGTFYAYKDGGGIIIPDSKSENIKVLPYDVRDAIHGDRVLYRLRISDRSTKKITAIILKVLKRSGTTLVGIFKSTKSKRYFIPDDKRFPENIPIDFDRSINAENGQKVVAYIEPSENQEAELRCRITEVLGYPGDAHLDIEGLLRINGLTSEFPPAVIKEVEQIPNRVPRAEVSGREDLRGLITITIDPESAKDFDDAISLEITDSGNYLLGVHIADVSYYIKDSTAVDTEALARGTSVYPVDRVIPMLPEKLSNNLCSLKPKVDRLTVSCIMEINRQGRVISSRLTDSVIRSNARLTYTAVQKYFDRAKGFSKKTEIAAALDKMLELSRILRGVRIKRGSIDFDLPEPFVSLDKQGRVMDITPYPRYDSHRLIEEFMLAANVSVAKFALSNHLPILYRVHDKPDPDKIENFAETLKDLGYKFSFRGEITPKKLQRIVDAVEGKPEERLINELLLRTMKKAVYQPKNIGHFALGFPAYTHFTSPIRRYPDLLVHRIVKRFIGGGLDKRYFDKYRERLEKIGEICSERERLAEKVERESIKIKAIQYISQRIGNTYWGVISGIVRSGLFVKLDDIFVDGFIGFSALGDDYYVYDEQHHQAVGRKFGRTFRLGDRVEVMVSRADMERNEVDLLPVEAASPARIKRRLKRYRRLNHK